MIYLDGDGCLLSKINYQRNLVARIIKQVNLPTVLTLLEIKKSVALLAESGGKLMYYGLEYGYQSLYRIQFCYFRIKVKRVFYRHTVFILSIQTFWIEQNFSLFFKRTWPILLPSESNTTCCASFSYPTIDYFLISLSLDQAHRSIGCFPLSHNYSDSLLFFTASRYQLSRNIGKTRLGPI